jgi:MFS family permease
MSSSTSALQDSALARRVRDSLQAFRDVFRNANLRRLELAAVGSNIGGWAFTVGVAVFAFEEDGAAAVGIVAAVRLIASAVFAPFAGVLADRFSRRDVMLAADLVRAGARVLCAGAVSADLPAEIIYGLTTFVTVATTAFGPAESALLPSLARSPEQLTAANAVTSTVESAALFIGPALGGLLLAVTGPEVVFLATAASFVWSGSLVWRITHKESAREAAEGDGGIVRGPAEGFRTVISESRVRLIVGLYAAQTFVDGALNVLVVVAALELLDIGEAGVGFLNSVIGVGGLVGGVVAIALVGRRRLAGSLGIGIVLWGAPIALIGIWPNAAAALALLLVVGVGNTILDVAALTLLQRAVPDEVLGRVFGVLESLILASIAAGALAAPLLISALETRGALIVTGAFLPVVALAVWSKLAAIDRAVEAPSDVLDLLRAHPIFAPLSPPKLEQLAASAEEIHVEPRSTVFRQGDQGDRFYLVRSGELEVTVDGQRAQTLGPGDGFGEIALLRDVPRTATVTTQTEASLLALERDEFIAAVTGHAESLAAADATVTSRLESLRPRLASL